MSFNPNGSSASKNTGEPIISKDSIIIQHLEAESTGLLKGRAAKLHSSEIVAIYPFNGPQDFATRLISIDLLGNVVKSEWKADKAVEVQQVQLVTNAVQATAYSPVRSLLALASREKIEIFRISATDGFFRAEPVAELSSPEGRIATDIDFDPSGQSLLIGGLDGRVYRWLLSYDHLSGGISLERYYGHSAAINSVAYHPFGGVFFSADKQGVLSAWLPYEQSSILARQQRAELFAGRFFADRAVRSNAPRGGNIDSLFNLTPSGDGEFLFLSRNDGSIEVWQTRGLRRLVTLQAHSGIVYDLAIGDSPHALISIGRDSRIRFWQLSSSAEASLDHSLGEFHKMTEIHQETLEGARRLAVLGDEMVAVGFRTGEVRLINRVHKGLGG